MGEVWVVFLALAGGAFAVLTLRDTVGANLLVLALVAALATVRRSPRVEPWNLVWAVVAVAFAVLPTVRDDSWLHPFTSVAALGFASLALCGGDTWRAMLWRPWAVLLAVPAALPWAGRGLSWVGLRTPLIRALFSTAVVAGVFGALFFAADSVFADTVTGWVPELEGPTLVFVGVPAALLILGAGRVASRPPVVMADRPKPAARGTLEWALPLVVLDVVFLAFVYVQAAVLYGGYRDVVARSGMNYSEYARQGFGILVVVTVLTLVVIALATRFGPARGEPGHKLLTGLLGVLCALAIVVVASALRRLDLYVEMSGLTRLRVCAATLELWLGVLLFLILVAGGSRLLPRLAGLTGAVILLTVGLVSPDALIARNGLDRYASRGSIDTRDLEELGASAVPWLDKLPEPQRSCLLGPVARDLASGHDAWFETNVDRERARKVLAARPVLVNVECEVRGRY